MIKKGYIYVGYDKSGKGFKIGKTSDPARREKEIKHMNPSFLILARAEVEDVNGYEKHFHEMFASKRIVGEWFDLSAQEVSELVGKVTPEEITKLTGRL